MLPIFQVASPNFDKKNMSLAEISAKPRQRRVNVPVHRILSDNLETKKTFSANFNTRRYAVSDDKVGKTTTILEDDEPMRTEIIVETIEPDTSTRITKKQLSRENMRLVEENRHLSSKFHELEELSVKKITKLREKINVLQLANTHFKKDIEELEENFEQILHENETLKYELEKLRVCKKCEDFQVAIENCHTESEKYQKENESVKNKYKELHEDLQMLKIVVFRLNTQLERYQELLRRNNIPRPSMDSYHKRDIEISGVELSKEILSDVHRDHKHIPVLWGNVNKHTLGPLLDAYEDSIKEKDEIIEEYESEMNKFTGKMREIMEENECLYKRLNEDENCSSKLSIELESVKRELKNTKDQNDALIKKCSLKQDKLEEVLRIYEAKVDQMTRDYDVLHGEYVKIKTENAALVEKAKSCMNSQEELRSQLHNFIPIAVHNSSVNECKKWYEELKLQYEAEKEKLVKNIESHVKTIEDLNKEIGNLNSIKEKLENNVSHLEKQIKKLETKQLEIEHNLNGVQLSRSALKKQLHKAMEFARDMVAEQEMLLKALNQRQIENKAVKKIGSDIASRMDYLKSQLKDVQKNAWQDFATVEQTIQDQANTIETMKGQYEKEIDGLKSIIARFEDDKDSNIKPENMSMAHYFLLKNKYK
ncbi:unnamed protein product [Psylliodes chrysocephalus]|uniref:Uncharacterized protein n=1 Tax=Psylliodes chrysocephalus TaxID=3402493 RepID=A0A9P0CDQ0_9CUCU|nr:unnamed protein product [Psylliodes chrysocephala]